MLLPNFEAGAAWIQRRIVIPVCYGSLRPRALPPPYASKQAVEIPGQTRDLISALAKHLRVSTLPEPDPDVNEFRMERARFKNTKDGKRIGFDAEEVIKDPYVNLEFVLHNRK